MDNTYEEVRSKFANLANDIVPKGIWLDFDHLFDEIIYLGPIVFGAASKTLNGQKIDTASIDKINQEVLLYLERLENKYLKFLEYYNKLNSILILLQKINEIDKESNN